MISGNPTEVIRELWGTVQGEIEAERRNIIQNELEEALRGIKIGMENLDTNLIDSLMSSAATRVAGGTPAQPQRGMEEIVAGCFEKPIKHPKVAEIITDILSGNNVYLYGRAGTGKTYMAKTITTTMLGLMPEILNCSQWTSPIQIIGGQTIEGYQQGSLVRAWREGMVLILDELPKLDPNTAGLLNDALAQSADKLKPCQIFFEGDLSLGTILWMPEQSGDGIEEMGREVKGKVFCVKQYDIEYWYFTDRNGALVKVETLKGGESTPIVEIPDEIDSGQVVYFAPTIKDGKGDLAPKHPDFHVIATGNTDMKDTGGNAYGGNNRQDYSLVDRFSGSYYKIEYDTKTEEALTYRKVFRVSEILRKFLDSVGAIESISLRTMLNFNRIYEQGMLAELGSELAIQGFEENQIKTLKDSVNSFVDAINPKSTADKLRSETDLESVLNEEPDFAKFIEEFWEFHGHQDAMTGDVIDSQKLSEVVADFI
jgi:hypothetical protein